MTPGELKDRIERLPKWAQDHIDLLTRQLANVTEDRRLAYEAFNYGKTSSIYQHEYGTGPKIYLPSDREVTFLVPDPEGNRPEEFSVSFDRQYRTDEIVGIKVRTGWGCLAVHPDCANGITIRKRGRD